MQDEVKSQSGEGDDSQAHFQQGEMYRLGEGTDIDLEEAIIWYQRASEQGHTHAQFELAKMYATGQGVSLDPGKAVTLFEAAAKQGHVSAQYNLGQMYRSGEGVDRNLTRASEWYLEAAKAGDADAQLNLAVCYQEGSGVPKDLEKTHYWLTIAAAQDHRGAVAKLQQLQASDDDLEREAFAAIKESAPPNKKSAKSGGLVLLGVCSVFAFGGLCWHGSKVFLAPPATQPLVTPKPVKLTLPTPPPSIGLGVITGPRASARGKATVHSQLVFRFGLYEPVNILEEITLAAVGYGEPRKWYRVQVPIDAGLWVHHQFLHNQRIVTIVGNDGKPSPHTYASVKSNSLNVRGGAGDAFPVLGQLPQGTDVALTGAQKGEWLEIFAPGNCSVYVASQFVKRTDGLGGH
jgi:hypothetical protein